MRCLKSSGRWFWGGLGPRPGSPGSLPLSLASLDGESEPHSKSFSGPGLWHAADWCLMLALGWWFEGLLKSVDVSETSAVSTLCPLLTFLFDVFPPVPELCLLVCRLPALRSRLGTTESSLYPLYLAWCLAHRSAG